MGGKCVGLPGRLGLIPPTFDHFGHDRMAGEVIAFGDPLGGMGV